MVDDDLHNSVIVDFMAFRPAMGAQLAHSDGNIELGTFYLVEVKGRLADFASGHGLNFRGDQNRLVCERELAEVPDKSRRRLISHIKTTPDAARRDHSAAFLLFQMMKRGVGR